MALLLIPTILVANLVGAVVVFVLAAWVVPSPTNQSVSELIANLAVAGGYVILAMLIGVVWGVRRYRATLRWLFEERAPNRRVLYRVAQQVKTERLL